MKVKFAVEGDAVPQSRPRFTRNGHAYIPARSRQWRDNLRIEAFKAMDGREPMTGEVSLVVGVYRRYAPSSPRFGDVDNHLKQVADALNGICYVDDRQIVEATAAKHRDKEPHIEILICTLGE